jgi:hypothetical protein
MVMFTVVSTYHNQYTTDTHPPSATALAPSSSPVAKTSTLVTLNNVEILYYLF